MLQYESELPVDIWYWAYCSLNSEEKLTLFWDQWFGVLSWSGITDTVNLLSGVCFTHIYLPTQSRWQSRQKQRISWWRWRSQLLGFSLENVQHLTSITYVFVESINARFKALNQLMLSGLYDSQLGTMEMSGYKLAKQKTADLLPSLANQDILYKARLVIFGLHKQLR